MNPALNFKEKQTPSIMKAHDNVLVAQNAQKPFHRHSGLLSNFCQLHVAYTEQEALEILQEVSDVSLIISDSTMLEAGNFKLLKYLKRNSMYQQIRMVNLMPVAEDPTRFIAFSFTLSDFSMEELQGEELPGFIKKVLTSEDDQPTDHHGIRTAYGSGKLLSPEDIKLMNELEKRVLLHLSDGSYDTTKLAFDLHFSRSTLTRKIRYLFGVNPGEYITRIRMNKALYYLQNRHYSSIAQVASAVGFHHAGSFSRCFHHHFGMPPSAI